MMLGLQGLRGLGTDYRIDCSGGSTNGQTIDCDSWGNFFNETCWGICSASNLATTGNVPPPVAPSGLCSIVPSFCDATGSINTIVLVGGAIAATLLALEFLKK